MIYHLVDFCTHRWRDRVAEPLISQDIFWQADFKLIDINCVCRHMRAYSAFLQPIQTFPSSPFPSHLAVWVSAQIKCCLNLLYPTVTVQSNQNREVTEHLLVVTLWTFGLAGWSLVGVVEHLCEEKTKTRKFTCSQSFPKLPTNVSFLYRTWLNWDPLNKSQRWTYLFLSPPHPGSSSSSSSLVTSCLDFCMNQMLFKSLEF